MLRIARHRTVTKSKDEFHYGVEEPLNFGLGQRVAALDVKDAVHDVRDVDMAGVAQRSERSGCNFEINAVCIGRFGVVHLRAHLEPLADGGARDRLVLAKLRRR